MPTDYLAEMRSHEQLVAREKAENDAAITRARAIGGNVTFIAADGCEVTVTPGGHVFHNAADWW